MKNKIQELLVQIELKRKPIENGDFKIADVLRGQTVDRLPLIFYKPKNASTPGRTYNLKEQFYDKSKMLIGHLEEIEECVANAYDAPLCIRPNFGTVFIPSAFGLAYKVFEDKYPWIDSHLTKEEIKKYKEPDIQQQDLVMKAVEYIQYFKEIVPNYIHIYQPDTQGPFDLAHLVLGDDLFYEMHDDPIFVHYLMEICTEMYIKVSKIMKNAIGERISECYHGHALARGIFIQNGGVRISEDSATLISPNQIEEFVIPYVKKALNEFGGGFIHFCGKNQYLLDSFLQLEEVRAINLGNPEMYDFRTTMDKFLLNNKCYFGSWPSYEDEDIEHYVYRMKEASNGGKKGLLLHFNENMFENCSCDKVMELWTNK